MSEEQVDRKDKNCLLKFTEDEVLLKLRLDNDPNLMEIENFLEKNSIMEVDYDRIKDRLNNQEDNWFKVAENINLPSEDDKAEIEVSSDGLKALLDFTPGRDGIEFTYEDLKKMLAEKNISYGINENKIKSVLKKRQPVSKEIIAEGQKAKPGQDGYLIYHFEEKKESVGTLREDGTMDFHSKNLINNVRRGEKIVTKVDPTEGEAGKDVFGKEIEPPTPKEAKLPRAKNTVKKNNSVYAAKDGQIVREGKKISIDPVYQVRGDVDLEEGNIDFVGSVKVGGNVREGFKIKASGDVEVAGNVAAAEIESGGSVLIKKGFLGRNKGKITANGDVNARFVENAEIEANNVRVHEAIMHSHVTAKDSIIVSGGKGLIVGGRVMAQNIIEANIIGSSLATKTYVEIGLEPELRKNFKTAKDELETVEDNLDKVNKSVDLLRSMKEKGIKLPANKREMFLKLKITKEELENRRVELKKEIEELEEQLTASDQAVIKVKECIFPGVQLLSSKDKMIIRNKISKCAFTEVNKELRQKID
ncbi:MAG: DUF342 domain-containing protein [Halanaerobium sp.]